MVREDLDPVCGVWTKFWRDKTLHGFDLIRSTINVGQIFWLAGTVRFLRGLVWTPEPCELLDSLRGESLETTIVTRHWSILTPSKKLYGLLYTVHRNRIATVLCQKFVQSKIGPDPTDACIQKGTDGQTWSRLKRITIWPNSFSKVIFALCGCNRIGKHICFSRSCDFVEQW